MAEQFGLFSTYPHGPGFRDVDTSRKAADEIAPRVGRLQQVVLDAIKRAGNHGLTTNELADKLRISRDSIQPRTTELCHLGLIVDSGHRRQNFNGKSAKVWMAAR